MSTLREGHESFHRKLVLANWIVFGVAVLFIGFGVISGAGGWLLASIPFVWIFGLLSGGVIGGNILMRRLDEK